MTPEGIETEYWAHYHAENPGKEAFEDDDFDDDALDDIESIDDWETLIDD